MTTPEGKIEAYLVKRVRETGGKVRKLKWIGYNGAPDRMIWWPLKNRFPVVYFVEVKAPGEKPTAQQMQEHKKLHKDGFPVFVIDKESKVEALLAMQDRVY